MCSHFVVMSHEATQLSVTVGYVREVTVKKSCKYGECGYFEHLLFLLSKFSFRTEVNALGSDVTVNQSIHVASAGPLDHMLGFRCLITAQIQIRIHQTINKSQAYKLKVTTTRVQYHQKAVACENWPGTNSWRDLASTRPRRLRAYVFVRRRFHTSLIRQRAPKNTKRKFKIYARVTTFQPDLPATFNDLQPQRKKIASAGSCNICSAQTTCDVA